MTIAEAAILIVQLTRDLSATHGEREIWRGLALASIERASALERELQVLDERRLVCRLRLQDERDVFLDQTDLRREAAA